MKKGIDKLSRIQTGYVWIDPRKCEGCWKCLDTCKQQVIGKVGFLWHKHIVMRNPADCTGCRKCMNACPNGVFNLV